MDKRVNNKGTKGNKGGRKPKSEEQKLIENLTPMHPNALKALGNAIKASEPWAIKLFMQYFYGMPKQIIEQITEDKTVTFEVIQSNADITITKEVD